MEFSNDLMNKAIQKNMMWKHLLKSHRHLSCRSRHEITDNLVPKGQVLTYCSNRVQYKIRRRK